MPRQPLVDRPGLPPYGQRSSERRKEQNRLAQRQLRQRRQQQEAAQALKLQQQQNEIRRLNRLITELQNENFTLKSQSTFRRRQSVIPISSLSRGLGMSHTPSNMSGRRQSVIPISSVSRGIVTSSASTPIPGGSAELGAMGHDQRLAEYGSIGFLSKLSPSEWHSSNTLSTSYNVEDFSRRFEGDYSLRFDQDPSHWRMRSTIATGCSNGSNTLSSMEPCSLALGNQNIYGSMEASSNFLLNSDLPKSQGDYSVLLLQSSPEPESRTEGHSPEVQLEEKKDTELHSAIYFRSPFSESNKSEPNGPSTFGLPMSGNEDRKFSVGSSNSFATQTDSGGSVDVNEIWSSDY